MSNYEVILLGGAPGSGKGTIGKAFMAIGIPEGARHMAIGDLKRDITAGKIASKYAEMLQQVAHPDRKTGAAPDEAMIGIMEEFIQTQPGGLTVLDGFPRYRDRIEPFRQSMRRIGARVLALAIVEADERILLERLGGREERPGQKIKDPLERLADHRNNVMPTLRLLAQDYPTYRLDGSLPIEVNAGCLLTIYEHHTASI